MGFLDDIHSQDLENANSFSDFKIGDNMARITKVEDTYSKNYNAMLVIHFENDSGATIRHYIVDNEYKLQKLKSLYLAFGIPFTEKNPQQWIGKQAVVVCREGKPYNGETRLEVHYVKPLNSNVTPPRQAPTVPSMYSTPEPPINDDGFADDIPF
jgi:hypothetical protein